jgi:hypothetical protein
MAYKPQTWMDSLDKWPKQWNMDIKFGMVHKWQYQKHYENMLDLVGGRWHRTTRRIPIFNWKGNEKNLEVGIGFLCIRIGRTG